VLFLRIYLLAGLVLHKTIWEVLKRRRGSFKGSVETEQALPPSSRSIAVKFVKAVKVAILIGIAAQTLLPDVLPIVSAPFALRIVGCLIYTIGLLISIFGRLELGENWSAIEATKVLRDHKVVAKGLYRLIRHPIYVGDLLLLLGLELTLNSWLTLGVILLVPIVVLQVVREEQQLFRSLPGYAAYTAHTKRFIPFVI
jgi:protein-S-isoprenylcysteine O-methyltransferase Ste14